MGLIVVAVLFIHSSRGCVHVCVIVCLCSDCYPPHPTPVPRPQILSAPKAAVLKWKFSLRCSVMLSVSPGGKKVEEARVSYSTLLTE